MGTCKIGGCDGEHRSRGFCAKHYARLLRHGHPGVRMKSVPRGYCKIGGCGHRRVGRGFCSKHYTRLIRYGHPGVRMKTGSGRLGYQYAHTPRATVRPTVRDIAWAAGFVEGEGSFSTNGSDRISVGQVELEPLHSLQALFGGSVYSAPGRACSEWRAYGSRARGIMMTLYPFLFSKRRKQVRTALSHKHKTARY